MEHLKLPVLYVIYISIKLGEGGTSPQQPQHLQALGLPQGECPSLIEEAMWGDFQNQVTDKESSFQLIPSRDT